MFNKIIPILKRLIFGYAFFLLLIIAGLTIELPFVLVIIISVGFIPIDGFPFPQDIFRIASIFSLIISFLVGLRWIYFPSPRLNSWLQKLHSYFAHSKKKLLFRFVGTLLAIPLFAFIFTPNAVVWIGLGWILNYLYPGEELSIVLYIALAFISGYTWLAIVIGQLCPPKGLIRRLILRCRLIFTDWVLEPANPRAAAEKRNKRYHDCKE